MKLNKILVFIISSLVIYSCNPTENPSLSSRWRLVKVDRLDYPSQAKFLFYPSKPLVKEMRSFSLDSDYQISSWSDSLRIEHTIIVDGIELYSYSATPYELIGDTIYYKNARYNFKIFEKSLIMNGSGDSVLGKIRFAYYFELDE